MSWSVTLQGPFHQIVRQVRNLRIDNDALGHVEIAKEMALCAVDKAPEGSLFSITLSGHADSASRYSVSANVQATEVE